MKSGTKLEIFPRKHELHGDLAHILAVNIFYLYRIVHFRCIVLIAKKSTFIVLSFFPKQIDFSFGVIGSPLTLWLHFSCIFLHRYLIRLLLGLPSDRGRLDWRGSSQNGQSHILNCWADPYTRVPRFILSRQSGSQKVPTFFHFLYIFLFVYESAFELLLVKKFDMVA